MIKDCLYIKNTVTKGRGVFTAEKINKGIVIEVAPVLVMSHEDKLLVDRTLLYDYIFDWGNDKNKCCIALGLVSIYNHSYTSNCEYFMDFKEDTIQIKTVREIQSGEELTINYNGDWNDEKQVWFDTIQ
ncbi:MAG: SET domain-containing protein [Ginsengibacter sp.]